MAPQDAVRLLLAQPQTGLASGVLSPERKRRPTGVMRVETEEVLAGELRLRGAEVSLLKTLPGQAIRGFLMNYTDINTCAFGDEKIVESVRAGALASEAVGALVAGRKLGLAHFVIIDEDVSAAPRQTESGLSRRDLYRLMHGYLVSESRDADGVDLILGVCWEGNAAMNSHRAMGWFPLEMGPVDLYNDGTSWRVIALDTRTSLQDELIGQARAVIRSGKVELLDYDDDGFQWPEAKTS